MRIALRFLLLGALAGAALAAWAFAQARADPVVRRAAFALPGWPAHVPPVRLVLMSDIHIGNAAMGPARLARIVAQVNALHPDIVLLAGDFIAGHDKGVADTLAPGLIAPLSGLRARLGTIAVLGNHDHWTGLTAVRRALSAAGIAVLENQAVRRGPLAIVGVGDAYTDHADAYGTLVAAARIGGVPIVVSHGPDIAPGLPMGPHLVLAGHTHCGQVVLPLVGALAIPSSYGHRYLCGAIREGDRVTVVTAGVGTSMVPFRLGALPDLWLISLGP